MIKVSAFWKALLAVPRSFWVPLLVTSAVIHFLPEQVATAQEAVEESTEQAQSRASEEGEIRKPVTIVLELPDLKTDSQVSDATVQVTGVSQLRDVSPGDWAYEELRNLVERYGCIAGYPDGSYRGNRTLTRSEFAASLNACLNRLKDLTVANRGKEVTAEDLATIRRLQEEFASELATLQTRVDSLEDRTAELEANQFSTTTKFFARAIFAVSAVNGGEKADGSGESVDDNIVFSDRVRLFFTSSFTGQDQLLVLLQPGNTPLLNQATGTPQTNLSFASPVDNDAVLDILEYRFPLGENGNLLIEASGGLFEYFTPITYVENNLTNSSDLATVSTFGFYNPIFLYGRGTGAGLNYDLGDLATVALGYLANEPDDPSPGSGLFNGPYGALAQLTLHPSDTIDLGLTYIRSYNAINLGFLGTTKANEPFAGTSDSIGADSFGAEAIFQVSPTFTLRGWFGLTQARALDLPGDPQAEIASWAVTLGFPDLGKEGNLAGIVVGQQPQVTSNDYRVAGSRYEDGDTSLHIETFYRYQFTDNIAITPGFFVITNPNGNEDNNALYVTTVRTTFSF
jgi:hypothetical protein